MRMSNHPLLFSQTWFCLALCFSLSLTSRPVSAYHPHLLFAAAQQFFLSPCFSGTAPAPREAHQSESTVLGIWQILDLYLAQLLINFDMGQLAVRISNIICKVPSLIPDF